LWLPAPARAEAEAGPWVNVNPGAGGAFTAIGAGPSGIIVAGSDLAGAYRSLDHGASWEIIGAARGLAKTHVNSVGFDPAAPRCTSRGPEAGLSRSPDLGATFPSALPSVFVSATAPAPSAPATVSAAGSSRYNSLDAQLELSADRGLTWRRLS